MPLRVLILFLFPLWAAAQGPPLTTLAEVRAVPHEAAESQRYPVLIEGTVIFFQKRSDNLDKAEGLILHDGTAGCHIAASLPFPERDKIRPGTRLRVRGVTRGASYFPDIVEAKLEILHQGKLPEPRRVTAKELFANSIDSDWIEVEALVVGVAPGGLGFTLVVEIDGLTFLAELPKVDDAAVRAEALMQKRVLLRGIVGSITSRERQLTDRYFFVPSFDQLIPIEGNPEAGKVPLRTITSLLQSDHERKDEVRVHGVITQLGPGGFFLRDETGSTFVQSAMGTTYPPGSEVEVQGFAVVAPFRSTLRAARVLLLGKGERPPPSSFDPAGGPRFDLHAERVVTECEFLAYREGLEEVVLQCRAGSSYFLARSPRSTLQERNLQAGDQIRLTGIYTVTTTRPMPRTKWADGFRLNLSGDASIEVLRPTPWMTPERVQAALAILGAILIAIFAWNWLLRKRVAAQAATIRNQVKQGLVKDERQRIARELHDTLEQDLTGLSMQLGNLTTSLDDREKSQNRLTLARNMLKHCRAETRASISDLRSPSLLKKSLPEAIQEILPPVAEGSEFRFIVEGTPRKLPATTTNHLVRIAREAVINARRHAKPTWIEVSLHYETDEIRLEIIDDGSGFDPKQRPPAGHFGITGMRERANKIFAELEIESSPSIGTKVQLRLPSSSPANQSTKN